ncbi:MAG TPA: peptidase M28 [Microscillaceae bacterium]|nr:peptidase M28 [Microscillaceae bacterium]
MKKIIFTLILGSYWVTIWAQKQAKDLQAIKFAQTITQKDLSKHLHIVASDEMEGRRTGTPGQKKAAKYIANHFKKIGLKPPVNNDGEMSYYQPFSMKSTKWKEVYVDVAGQRYAFMKDVFALGVSAMKAPLACQAVFVGNGSPEEMKQAKVKGKGVVYFAKNHAEAVKKGKVATNLGAKALFVLRAKTKDEYKDLLNFNAYYVKRWVGPKLSKKTVKSDIVFYVSPRLAAAMLNTQTTTLANNQLKPGARGQQVKALATQEEKITLASENVMGLLEGTTKKDEILVISAHYDHIGKYGNQINNGADDDGSGTVAVLELAEAFVKAKKAGEGPKRSILFITVAGEEMGLYGSRFYTDIDPVFPLKNTVADLNIDMIGRIDDRYKTDPNYIYLIGSDKLSTELHQLSEEANRQYIGLKLDYKYNDENDPNRFYYRSDHYNFAKNRIPVIFYFNGTHADYHRPTDTVDKIHFAKMEKIARLIFHTAWKIANRPQRIKVDK